MELSRINLSAIENFKDLSPEFYRPENIRLSNVIRSGEVRRIGSIAYVTDGEHGSPMWDTNSNIKYITAEFVKPNFIDEGITKTISLIQDLRNARARVKEKDVLIYSVGAYAGYAALAEPHLFPANIPRSVAIVRINTTEILPEFLSVFLNSKFGVFQSHRFRAGNSQPVLALEKIKQFEVPVLEKSFQQKTASLYQEAYLLRCNSKERLLQATQLLEDALGLNNIEFKKEKSYTASISEVVSKNRADADYYQTKYRQLESHLESINTVRLGSICSITKGVEVGSAAYAESGPLFIRVSNLNREGFLQGNSDKYISQSLYNSLKLYQPNTGDILLTKDGTIGTCYVVDEAIEGIISSGILNISVFNPLIPKEYLALVINSKACTMQASRDCSGALILHWKPEDIRKLRIPILSNQLMNELAELAYQSKLARRESKRLLEQAKKEVEHLIEEAAQKI